MEGRSDLAPQEADQASVSGKLHQLLDDVIKEKSSANPFHFFSTIQTAFNNLEQKELLDFDNAMRVVNTQWLFVPKIASALLTFDDAGIDTDDPDIQNLLKIKRNIDGIALDLAELKKAGVEDKSVWLWVAKYSDIYSQDKCCATEISLILKQNDALNSEDAIFKTQFPTYRLIALYDGLNQLKEAKITDKNIYKTLVDTSLANLSSAVYEEKVAALLIAICKTKYNTDKNLLALSQASLWSKQFGSIILQAFDTLSSYEVDQRFLKELFRLVLSNPYLVKPVLEILSEYQQRFDLVEIFYSVVNGVDLMKLELKSMTKEELQEKLLTQVAERFNRPRPNNFYKWFVQTGADKGIHFPSPDEKSECRII